MRSGRTVRGRVRRTAAATRRPWPTRRPAGGWRSEREHRVPPAPPDVPRDERGIRHGPAWDEWIAALEAASDACREDWNAEHFEPLLGYEPHQQLVLARDDGGPALPRRASRARRVVLELLAHDGRWLSVRYEWGWDDSPPTAHLALGGLLPRPCDKASSRWSRSLFRVAPCCAGLPTGKAAGDSRVRGARRGSAVSAERALPAPIPAKSTLGPRRWPLGRRPTARRRRRPSASRLRGGEARQGRALRRTRPRLRPCRACRGGAMSASATRAARLDGQLDVIDWLGEPRRQNDRRARARARRARARRARAAGRTRE